MNVLGSIPFRVRAALDRDLMIWAVGPALGAILVTTLFVIPNYARALRMQDEAQRLEAFRQTLHLIHRRLEIFINLPLNSLDKMGLEKSARELART